MATSEIAITRPIDWTRPVSTKVKRLAAAVGMAAALAAVSTFIVVSASPGSAGPALDLARVKSDRAVVAFAEANPGATLQVVVTEDSPASEQAEQVVSSLGGTVAHRPGLQYGFAATLPASQLGALADSPSVPAIYFDR